MKMVILFQPDEKTNFGMFSFEFSGVIAFIVVFINY